MLLDESSTDDRFGVRDWSFRITYVGAKQKDRRWPRAEEVWFRARECNLRHSLLKPCFAEEGSIGLDNEAERLYGIAQTSQFVHILGVLSSSVSR